MVPPEAFRVGMRLNQELALQIALMMGRLMGSLSHVCGYKMFGNNIAIRCWSTLQVCLWVARGLLQNERQNKNND